MNLKNYSQIKFGESEHIQQAYDQQAANKKAMAKIFKTHVERGGTAEELGSNKFERERLAPKSPVAKIKYPPAKPAVDPMQQLRSR